MAYNPYDGINHDPTTDAILEHYRQNVGPAENERISHRKIFLIIFFVIFAIGVILGFLFFAIDLIVAAWVSIGICAAGIVADIVWFILTYKKYNAAVLDAEKKEDEWVKQFLQEQAEKKKAEESYAPVSAHRPEDDINK